MGNVNATKLFDLEVVGGTGWNIGKISDIMIDPSNWQVTALVVQLEKSISEEFNLKHRFSKTHIPLNVSHVQAVGDRVVLKSSKEEIFQQIAGSIASEQEQKTPA